MQFRPGVLVSDEEAYRYDIANKSDFVRSLPFCQSDTVSKRLWIARTAKVNLTSMPELLPLCSLYFATVGSPIAYFETRKNKDLKIKVKLAQGT